MYLNLYVYYVLLYSPFYTDARCGRWIPVKLDADVEIPTFIKHGECLDLSTEEKLQENWDKLLCSIKGRNYDVDGASALYALRI